MATESPDGSPASNDALAAMIERLRRNGVLTMPLVEDALRSVPRHLFLDGATLDAAYADSAVVVKTSEDGTALSSASQPAIVAAMLELSRLEPGHHVLEVGTGTGYNAALLSRIVGPDGHVVTIELEEDLAFAARSRLIEYGFRNIDVVTGDGAEGHAGAGPFDRIIVTTGATMVAPAWVDQLRDGGRLVTPVVDAAGLGLIHCFAKRRSKLEEIATIPCGFLPMRS